MKRERVCQGCKKHFSAGQKKALEKHKYCSHKCFLQARTSKKMSEMGKLKKTHGMSRTAIYKVWGGMKARCTNKNNSGYYHYGAKGITLAPEWYKFSAFYADMGSSYKRGLTLDRIDGTKGYSKENCRWATRKEQSSNLRNNVFVMCGNERVCVQECARRLGVHASTVLYRIKRNKLQLA